LRDQHEIKNDYLAREEMDIEVKYEEN
jgi:hypothetical protein